MTEKLRVCKDCVVETAWKQHAWDERRVFERGPGINVAWDVENPEPVLPKRPAPYPGPRCATHNRAAVKAAKAQAHDRKSQRVYGLAPGQYEELYAFQDGHCALCLRATGKTKRLAVDHDHKTGEVRGLLCSLCNSVLAHGRDDPEYFQRIIDYLSQPPFQKMGRLR